MWFDIDGLYTDNPNLNQNKKNSQSIIDVIESVDKALLKMGKESISTDVGSGGMKTKLSAAQVAANEYEKQIVYRQEKPNNTIDKTNFLFCENKYILLR